MAILTKTLFDNPYVCVGNMHDICMVCRSEYKKEHPDSYDYQTDRALAGQLDGRRVFKLFRNSNVPFVLCGKHIQEIAATIAEDADE